MTVAPEKSQQDTPPPPVPEGHVRLTIDGVEVVAPKGELLIRTAERLGVVIPRFCDHPLLDPAGACRQCLVEVEMGGRPMPKPQASCTMTVAEGMVVRTQHTSPVADKAQQGVMELLLINHPLDCPICDKGGECPLQNQALKHGRADSRFVDRKRTFPKPIAVTAQVLLDRERCVLCQRCTRFASQVAGDRFLDLLERGADQQVGTAGTAEIEGAGGSEEQSYFSGNTIQICPVGALTSAAYRFRARPFDLMSTPSVCEHCASGCAQRTDWRRGRVMRRLAGEDPAVNEEWNCDKGRFAFTYATAADRLTRPLVRDERTGELRPASWTEALAVAAKGLLAARDDGRGAGVLAGGRLTVEDAYAYAKFARVALGTHDVDFRARPHSDEELEFLASTVVGSSPDTGGVTYADLEAAPAVLCVAFEPEEESPIVFLRLRKAARKRGTRVFHIGQWSTPAVEKTATRLGPDRQPLGGLLVCAPGAEASVVDALVSHPEGADVAEALRLPGAVVLVGERAAEVPGLLSAVVRLGEATGARLAWVPRRAGERGALEAGAVPTLLPGGRPVVDAEARAEVEAAWGLPAGALPDRPGRDTDAILAAAASGELSALVVGGVDPDDLADPALADRALREVGFLVSLELRASAVTAHADVVLPVAPAVEKSGAYLNWEGRRRDFRTTLEGTGAVPDCRVLDTLAVEMDADLFTQTPQAAAADMARLGVGDAPHRARPEPPRREPGPAPRPADGQVVLATWRRLLDNGSLQDGEPHLARTARPVAARLSAATAERLGVIFGRPVTVATDRGLVTVPAEPADLPDDVVWLPANSGPATVRRLLGGHGTPVTVTPAADAGEPAAAGATTGGEA
ncbi:NADH dehydrogenase subunit G [Streptoalloteichus tenebrarius]|uniref:NADH-quinone oxidoreductase n=1 Tax=Streptoalloteichus tenebrarius (strain ATCC 17920 / DSM 40477 / JCM 4838 / CBS 697.72 / NBRC 16177 / NCIMB 11028 / NRRL B-12390 / A12253. 1 / ISP 5477) TaxID=1933 RepID=A0ABT1HY04_STRSD|nr:NADH-quinone oxidoreductase subunit G [Streptoalloteichus tenebrarius]MCP2260402.1 NADH dehydrogenase subunit G [Streptoalloteichus tenebrarius]